VLGSDGCDTIAALGAGVDRFKVGDEVYSFAWDNPKGGFYAKSPRRVVPSLPSRTSNEADNEQGD
jgi:NADPH:quinone reductase-like Zn-dependent oxidoreductase